MLSRFLSIAAVLLAGCVKEVEHDQLVHQVEFLAKTAPEAPYCVVTHQLGHGEKFAQSDRLFMGIGRAADRINRREMLKGSETIFAGSQLEFPPGIVELKFRGTCESAAGIILELNDEATQLISKDYPGARVSVTFVDTDFKGAGFRMSDDQ